MKRDFWKELYGPRFTVEQVAKACDLPTATLRSWFTARVEPKSDRKWIEPGKDDLPGQKGIATRLSLASAFRIGIAAELVKYGVAPKFACYAALAFSATNVADYDDRLQRIKDGRRSPGALFDKAEGETFFIFFRPDEAALIEHLKYPSPMGIEGVMVMLIEDNRIPVTIFDKMSFGQGDQIGQHSLLLVRCNRICTSIARRLGASPVYSKELLESVDQNQ